MQVSTALLILTLFDCVFIPIQKLFCGLNPLFAEFSWSHFVKFQIGEKGNNGMNMLLIGKFENTVLDFSAQFWYIFVEIEFFRTQIAF